jgi:GT2 family glycosyltransferase
MDRPRAKGKFLYTGSEKFFVRGVTYGTFRPNEDGVPYPGRDVVRQDFAHMAATGLNAVRTYTVPPDWLLDAAAQHGLRLMVGLPWEQHVTFLDSARQAKGIERRVREGVRSCAGHPAVLCYAIGNEIPASIVRWHGRRKVERYLERLYVVAKEADPDGLVTYVNFPTTEYLELPFVDLACFNVYLEARGCFDAYLARLQNIAGERPLIMAELGLDSWRHGTTGQAEALDWQIRTAAAAGCAGAFVYSWTDEWHRGGQDIEDWDFGVTTRKRKPKPALAAVRTAFQEGPFGKDFVWPRVSVVVCTYNGARTLRQCCESLSRLNYPDYEVIVVNDGSSDSSRAIAGEYDFRLLTTENRGLSSARNTGMRAATGEIVAYIDDDAYAEPDWLLHVVSTFHSADCVAVGGPNIAPEGDGLVATCVAHAPGGPSHVLVSDREAEHIPGCNMAFRKSSLTAVGGFDTQFRVAGDDVDVCWKLQQRGWKLGFSPAAVVWHHRRNSVRTYWKQQQGYGRAEAMLEKKWPEKYNELGHPTWTGRMYGNGTLSFLCKRRRIYHGVWGSSPFQSIYETAPGSLLSLPLMPEWYLILVLLLVLSAIGLLWKPLLVAAPLALLAVGWTGIQAAVSAERIVLRHRSAALSVRLKMRVLTTSLYLLQPMARLAGRIRHGLAPWRKRCALRFAIPWPRTATIWSENWRSLEQRLESIESTLRALGAVVMRGNEHSRWDLQVWGGLFGAVRARMAIEEHGAGKQLIRLRLRPRVNRLTLITLAILGPLSFAAALDQAWTASAILALLVVLQLSRNLLDVAAAMASCVHSLRSMENASSRQEQRGARARSPEASVDPRRLAKVEVHPSSCDLTSTSSNIGS